MSERTARAGGVDPRGPRFAAGVTTVLLAIDLVLGLSGLATASAPVPQLGEAGREAPVPGGAWALPAAPLTARLLDPALVLLAVIAVLFLWGVVAPRTAPWGVVYRRLVQPRLAPPSDWEDPRPPRFAQGVGLAVASAGVILHLAGVPWALPVAAAMALVAAFLNAAFGLCLGCHLYLLLQRVGLLGRKGGRGAPSTR